jgi:Fic family protein
MSNSEIAYYTDIAAMEPMMPDSEELHELAVQLIRSSSMLDASLHPITRQAVAEFIQPMNSYYSNLIEGHDTHPIEIGKALKNTYSRDDKRKNLQIEALAHISVQKKVVQGYQRGDWNDPYAPTFIKEIHKLFYDELPPHFKEAHTIDNKFIKIIPGAFRTLEVKVGNHIAPHSSRVEHFMARFHEAYSPVTALHRSAISRIIASAAAHHRLAWIHPFQDGNGRAIRIFSDCCMLRENIHSGGIWSVSRGLARNRQTYLERLSNADMQRYNAYDGRGNLSMKHLIAFCQFFLETCIDQAEFMRRALQTDEMIARIHFFVEWMTSRNLMRTEARELLVQCYLKGNVSRSETLQITGLSDKTAKMMTDALERMGLLKSRIDAKQVIFSLNWSIESAALLFPGLYPADKEQDMLRLLHQSPKLRH